MSMTDYDGELGIDASGYRVGQHYFRSFLLAGERYVANGTARPDTDEARFRDFIEGIDGEPRVSLNRYFTRQRSLAPLQRAKVVGLENVRIETPLVLRNTAPELFVSRSYQQVLTAIAANRARHGAKAIADKHSPVSPDTLRLYLNKLKVEDSQDKTLWFNSTDEISIGVIATDETGDVSQRVVTVGDISDGNTKSFDGSGLKLIGFRADSLQSGSYPHELK